MLDLWLKAFHIVGVVSWFAGLFYHGRLLVYHAEALVSPEPQRGILAQQYTIMEWRLFHIIMNPAMGVTIATGAGMLLTVTGRGYITQPWMLAKLALVGLLLVVHRSMRRSMLELAAGRMRRSPEWFRLFNEVPTLILVVVTLLAVFKTALPWRGLGAVVVVLVVALLGGTRAYARHRHKGHAPLGSDPS
jgi:protoporphyrinogen IX oxidase